MEQHSPQDKKTEIVRVRKVSMLLSWYSCWLTILTISASVTHEAAFCVSITECFNLFILLWFLAVCLSEKACKCPITSTRTCCWIYWSVVSLQLLSKKCFSCIKLFLSSEINICVEREDTSGCYTYSITLHSITTFAYYSEKFNWLIIREGQIKQKK